MAGRACDCGMDRGTVLAGVGREMEERGNGWCRGGLRASVRKGDGRGRGTER